MPKTVATRGVRLAGLSLAVLAALTATVWIIPGLLDWNRYRGAIASFAAGQLGRPVRIDGAISVVLLPAPLVIADTVSLGDRGDGITVTAPSLRLRLALPALLLGRVVPRALILRGAAITLPWPLPPAALTPDRPDWLNASSARIEGGRLRIGALQLTDLSAELSAGGAESGGFVVAGSARSLGQRWRIAGRLGVADAAGGAPFEATADADPQPATAPAPDIGGRFVGTLAADGGLSGRLTAHAADLSGLLPAPPVAASADGTLALGRGPAQAQVALSVGGVAVSAQLQPDPRRAGQVLSLSTGTLDLDVWGRALSRLRASRAPARMIRLPWPVSLDLNANAARLRGGLIRAIHAAVDVDGERAVLRDGSAVLPGDAPVTLNGTLTEADGLSLAGEWTLGAPQLRATLRWLADCGLRLGADLPPDVLRQARLAGHVTAARDRVEIDRLNGSVDQSNVGGRIGVDTASGAVDAALTVDRLDGDDWLPPGPAPRWAATSQALSGFGLALKLNAGQVSFRGDSISGLSLDAATDAGGLAVNGADFDLDGLHGHLSGTIGADGQVTDGHLDLGAPHGSALARTLPEWARFTDYLWAGPVRLQATANGPMTALITSIGVDLADARLEAHPLINLVDHSWKAQLTLRHPGAPRLLAALGLPAARDWLGEGSLSVLAQLSGAPGVARLDSFDLTAATLHATGDLQWAEPGGVAPVLTGHIAADTLPLPFYAPHSTAPVSLAWLSGFSASLDVTAAAVQVGDTELLHGARAGLKLASGVVTLAGLTAQIGGGTVTGAASLDTAASPPRFAVQAQIAGAVLGGPLFGSSPDLDSGRIAASFQLAGQGYSPASVLASLSGSAHLAASAGSISGMDLVAAHLAGDADALGQALGGGSTGFDALQGDVTLADGTATLANAGFAGSFGASQWSGSVDLPAATMNLLALLPDQRSLRLTGPVAAPRRAIGAEPPVAAR